MREKYIDIMKGISMLAIMSVHLPQDYIIIKYGLSFMVPIFFVISGFFLTLKKQESLKESLTIWYRKNGRKIIWAYFSLSVWSIVISAIVTFLKGEFRVLSIASLAYQTVSGLGILTLWFLPALVIGEVIIIVLRKLFIRCTIIVIFMTLGVLIFANKMSINGIFGKACYDFSNPIYMVCINGLIVIAQGMLASFFLNFGIILKTLVNNIRKCEVINLILFGGFLEIIQIIISRNVIADMHYMNMITPIKFMLVSLLGILGVMMLSIAIDKLKRGDFLSYIGKNTLFIMGTHHNFMLTNLSVFLITRSGLNITLPIVVKDLLAFFILVCMDLALLVLCNRLNIKKYILFDFEEKK